MPRILSVLYSDRWVQAVAHGRLPKKKSDTHQTIQFSKEYTENEEEAGGKRKKSDFSAFIASPRRFESEKRKEGKSWENTDVEEGRKTVERGGKGWKSRQISEYGLLAPPPTPGKIRKPVVWGWGGGGGRAYVLRRIPVRRTRYPEMPSFLPRISMLPPFFFKKKKIFIDGLSHNSSMKVV